MKKKPKKPNPSIYRRRLRSAQASNPCKCKVGACPVCSSRCKRCMCACDGVDPSEALKRSRGGYRKQVNMINAQRKAEKETNRVSTRAMSKRSKKRKYNPHFNKVGKLDSARSNRSRHQPTSTKKKRTEKVDSDTSYHLSDEETTILEDDNTDMQSVPAKDPEQNDTMPTLTEFKLQIEGVDSDDDDILCAVVKEDESGPPPEAVTIADVVRGKRKEAIFREKLKKQQHSTSKVTTTNLKASTSLVTIGNKNKTLGRAEKFENFLGHFNLPKYWLRVIPSFVLRENEPDLKECSTKKSFGRLSSLCTRIVDTAIKTIVPGPGFPKIRKYLLNKMSEGFETIKKLSYRRTETEKLETVIKTIFEWSNRFKKRCIERCVIRAILN